MLTQSDVKNRIKKMGMELYSQYHGMRDKAKLEIKCKCGNVFFVSPKHILTGHTKSCGCLQRPSMVGKRFGKLVVLSRAPNHPEKSYGGRWWLCKCDCGTTKEYLGVSLNQGNVISCGCSRFGENSRQWKGYKCITGKFMSLLRCSAKNRNILVEVDKEYLYSLLKKQKFRCALSGEPIKIHNKGEENTASLDRIDSSKGYVKENVQWLHKRVNKMKLDDDDGVFLEWCKKIVSHQNRIDNL